MTKRKATKRTDANPEKQQLTWHEIDRLSRALAFDLMDYEQRGCVGVLLVLLQDIARHPFDAAHVETIANLLAAHLFAVTPDSASAADLYIAKWRERLLDEKGGTP